MKQKLLRSIDAFQNLCYMSMKMSAGDFAKENFPKLVENFWDDNKTDEDNLKVVKDMFEANRILHQLTGYPNTAQVIAAYQEGLLNKIKV